MYLVDLQIDTAGAFSVCLCKLLLMSDDLIWLFVGRVVKSEPRENGTISAMVLAGSRFAGRAEEIERRRETRERKKNFLVRRQTSADLRTKRFVTS